MENIINQIPDDWSWLPIVLAWLLPTPRHIVKWAIEKMKKKAG